MFLPLFLTLFNPIPSLGTAPHPLETISGQTFCDAIMVELDNAAARGDISYRQAHDIHTRCLVNWQGYIPEGR